MTIVRFKSVFLIAILVFSAIFALMGAKIANATSSYDNAYQSTSTLQPYISWAGWLTCSPVDVSTTWSEFMTDNTKIYNTNGTKETNFATNKTSFENALDHGIWGVSLISTISGSDHLIDVQIYWTENTTATLDFSLVSGKQNVKLNGTGIRTQSVSFKGTMGGSGCDLAVATPTTSTATSVFVSNEFGANMENSSASQAPISNFFVSIDVANINYPAGYAGADVVTGFSVDTNVAPKVGWNMSATGKLNGLIYDRQHANYPFLETSCFKTHWTITNDLDDTLVFGSYQNTAETFNYDFGSNLGDYTLSVTYYADIPCIEPDGYVFIPVTFPISYDGTRAIIGSSDNNTCSIVDGINVCDDPTPTSFEDCFTDTFPYLDLPTCVGNIKVLVNLLSFRTITFGNGWQGDTGCRTLVVLGDWLNIPAYEVCPQIPSEVRNVITPFVTLALGMVTITFLTRREGYL